MNSSDTVDARVREVFAATLSAEVASALSIDDSTETIASWDSQSFVAVVIGIESAFGLRFSTLEGARMNSVRGIQELLVEKGIELHQ